jgi:hypothetical protein
MDQKTNRLPVLDWYVYRSTHKYFFWLRNLIKVGQSSAQGPLELQSLVFGAATLSQVYNSEAQVNSDAPFRTVRLALRWVWLTA